MNEWCAQQISIALQLLQVVVAVVICWLLLLPRPLLEGACCLVVYIICLQLSCALFTLLFSTFVCCLSVCVLLCVCLCVRSVWMAQLRITHERGWGWCSQGCRCLPPPFNKNFCSMISFSVFVWLPHRHRHTHHSSSSSSSSTTHAHAHAHTRVTTHNDRASDS